METQVFGEVGDSQATNPNLLINPNGLVNQKGYVSGTATTGANEITLDMWKVLILGQALGFSTTANITTYTLPVGGVELVIPGTAIQSGTHVISFTATGDTVCTVDTVAKVSGDTFTLTGGTKATIKLSSAAGTGTIKLLKVESGSVATPFQITDDLIACMGYLQRHGQGLNGSAHTSTAVNFNIPLMIPMKGTPILTVIDTSISIIENTTSQTSSGSAASATVISKSGVFTQINGFTGMTAGKGVSVYSQTNDFLELTVAP